MRFFLILLISLNCWSKEFEIQSKSLEGSQYFGGVKSPKTRLQSFLFLYNYGEWFDFQFSYAYNNSYLKLYSVSVHKDILWDLSDQLALGLSVSLGATNYKETSSIQSSSLYGLNNFIGIKAKYQLNDKLSITGGYSNEHHWITKSFTDYWGSDPRSDYSFDFSGPFIGLSWRY